MLELIIEDMTCSHCSGVVTKAVHKVDASLVVDIDLSTKIVRITGDADTTSILKQLDSAGYTAQVRKQ
jgi:copper chaperone